MNKVRAGMAVMCLSVLLAGCSAKDTNKENAIKQAKPRESVTNTAPEKEQVQEVTSSKLSEDDIKVIATLVDEARLNKEYFKFISGKDISQFIKDINEESPSLFRDRLILYSLISGEYVHTVTEDRASEVFQKLMHGHSEEEINKVSEEIANEFLRALTECKIDKEQYVYPYLSMTASDGYRVMSKNIFELASMRFETLGSRVLSVYQDDEPSMEFGNRKPSEFVKDLERAGEMSNEELLKLFEKAKGIPVFIEGALVVKGKDSYRALRISSEEVVLQEVRVVPVGIVLGTDGKMLPSFVDIAKENPKKLAAFERMKPSDYSTDSEEWKTSIDALYELFKEKMGQTVDEVNEEMLID